VFRDHKISCKELITKKFQFSTNIITVKECYQTSVVLCIIYVLVFLISTLIVTFLFNCFNYFLFFNIYIALIFIWPYHATCRLNKVVQKIT